MPPTNDFIQGVELEQTSGGYCSLSGYGMSGEYFCIEEVGDPANYYDDYQKKGTKSLDDGVRHFYKDNEICSNGSRKSQDYRLHEIEEQLEVAENRCNTLKGKLDSMKQIYHKTGKGEPPHILRKLEPSLISKTSANEAAFLLNSRKRSCSPKLETSLNRAHHSPSKKRSPYNVYNNSCTDTVPQKSSSSSTGTSQNASRQDNTFQVPILRQNSNCIGTDHTGAAVRTINNILSGITSSFNTLAHANNNKQHRKTRRRSKDRYHGNQIGVVYQLPPEPFSPRVEKRMLEQQKKIEDLTKSVDIHMNPDIEHWTSQKLSKTSVKSKLHSNHNWDCQLHGKKHGAKSKIHTSAGSVNNKKSIKSTAKHVANTTKLRPIRTAMINDEAQLSPIKRKPKRVVKRLKPVSKVALSRKPSESDSRKVFEQYTTDNLVELYHNVAARNSDSDDSNNASKAQMRQKAGGDLPVPAIQLRTPFVLDNREINNKQLSTIPHSARTLSPIEEHTMAEQVAHSEYFTSRTRNYALPTISSTLKRATKCYLNTFNFRAIPFCAAKSTSPSHNIGINIQQVMSIIKTRQPISGISPTLAHNISLAAGKLQSHPLHAFVSCLSSRIGNGRSTCPLMTRSPINYNHLQELAKEIPEEPEDEHCDSGGDAQAALFNKIATSTNGPSGDRQGDSSAPVWPMATPTEDRCNCAPQKGVPFQQILSRYQVSELSVGCKKTTIQRPLSSDNRPTRPTFVATRKPRTAAWIKHDSKINHPAMAKQSQAKDLQGRERNLKTVLTNLHDEFDSLNTKYEDLAKTVGKNEGETPPEAVKQLEEMETALNMKEEEINMVMSLYTEVMALKDQVKRLREKTSQVSVAMVGSRAKTAVPSAALHLTQLLKQIQNYQDRCKSRK